MLIRSGQFAGMAKVSVRTLHYYEKIGLLKPSFIAENGYRYYSDDDLFKLQRIIALKNLGLRLDEIYLLTVGDDRKSLIDSLKLQSELVDEKLVHLNSLKETVDKVIGQLELGEEDIDILRLIESSNYEKDILDNYRNGHNLNVRINLHEKYGTNRVKWFDWLFKEMDLKDGLRILEVGCGYGSLWKGKSVKGEIFLSDQSRGMIKRCKDSLGNDYSYQVFDLEHIPFKDNYFDVVIANHVLFYAHDVGDGIKEIHRVLKDGGCLYASTYGRRHMAKIREITKAFNKRIELSRDELFSKFGIENAKELLGNCFKEVRFEPYIDELRVTDAMDVVSYVLSCHGNQNEYLNNHIEEFKKFIDGYFENGYLKIEKEAGLFKAIK